MFDHGPMDDREPAMDLLSTPDAEKWTDEFCRLFRVTRRDRDPDDTEDWQWGLMISWFANAIETGRSHPHDRSSERMAYLFGSLFKDHLCHATPGRWAQLVARAKAMTVERDTGTSTRQGVDDGAGADTRKWRPPPVTAPAPARCEASRPPLHRCALPADHDGPHYCQLCHQTWSP